MSEPRHHWKNADNKAVCGAQMRRSHGGIVYDDVRCTPVLRAVDCDRCLRILAQVSAAEAKQMTRKALLDQIEIRGTAG